MKDSLISFARRKLGGATSKEEILVIHQIARNRFSNDFPNPKREGCPGKESFEKMIGEKKLPGEDLRNHLFGCSECFSEYRELIERSKPIETANQPAAFFSPLKIVLAGSLSLCLIAFGS
jgi:hypothetical protein